MTTLSLMCTAFLLSADSRAACALEIGVNSDWQRFTWVDGVGGFTREGPFTFSSDEPVVFCITDTAICGDVFRIYDFGDTIGETLPVPIETSDCKNSEGAFLLPAGDHSISIQIIAGLQFGAGNIRVDTLDHVPASCLVGVTAGPDQSVQCTSAGGAVVFLEGLAFSALGDPLSF